MHPNAELIRRFYTAFGERDHQTMAACYRADAVFSDPVFPRLEGAEICAMWRMLCLRGTDLEITFDGVEADDSKGRADWQAIYTFSPTGRKVHNRIAADFSFEDGAIRRHHDDFDLYRWTRMALGPAGYLLGWSGLIRNKVCRQAGRSLEKFMAEEAAA
jgi:ketosteroid isomerase-like protein